MPQPTEITQFIFGQPLRSMSDLGTRAPLREVARAPAEPPPLSPLPENDGVSADAAGADPQAASAARYRRRVLLVLSAIVLTLVLYWARATSSPIPTTPM